MLRRGEGTWAKSSSAVHIADRLCFWAEVAAFPLLSKSRQLGEE